MGRVAKVEGGIKVFTDSGGSFSLSVSGHGMKDGQSILELGPYVGKLITTELLKVLDDMPKAPALPPEHIPLKPEPVRVKGPPIIPPKRAKGAGRG